MPYFLKKARGKDKYYVMDNSGRKYSHEPIPLARANKQLKALHIHTGHGRGGGDEGSDEELTKIMSQIAIGPSHRPATIPKKTIRALPENILPRKRSFDELEGIRKVRFTKKGKGAGKFITKMRLHEFEKGHDPFTTEEFAVGDHVTEIAPEGANKNSLTYTYVNTDALAEYLAQPISERRGNTFIDPTTRGRVEIKRHFTILPNLAPLPTLSLADMMHYPGELRPAPPTLSLADMMHYPGELRPTPSAPPTLSLADMMHYPEESRPIPSAPLPHNLARRTVDQMESERVPRHQPIPFAFERIPIYEPPIQHESRIVSANPNLGHMFSSGSGLWDETIVPDLRLFEHGQGLFSEPDIHIRGGGASEDYTIAQKILTVVRGKDRPNADQFQADLNELKRVIQRYTSVIETHPIGTNRIKELGALESIKETPKNKSLVLDATQQLMDLILEINPEFNTQLKAYKKSVNEQKYPITNIPAPPLTTEQARYEAYGSGHEHSRPISSVTPEHEKSMVGFTLGERHALPNVTDKETARRVLTNLSNATSDDLRHFLGEDIKTFRDLVKPTWKQILKYLHSDKGGTPEDQAKMNIVTTLVENTYGKGATITGSGSGRGLAHSRPIMCWGRTVHVEVPSVVENPIRRVRQNAAERIARHQERLAEPEDSDPSIQDWETPESKLYLKSKARKETDPQGSGHNKSKLSARVIAEGKRVIEQDLYDAQQRRYDRLYDRQGHTTVPSIPTRPPHGKLAGIPEVEGYGKNHILIGDRVKFAKKYLKGQGIRGTKKNIEHICNIMDVEGIVFE